MMDGEGARILSEFGQNRSLAPKVSRHSGVYGGGDRDLYSLNLL